jgi:hypothetical protein
MKRKHLPVIVFSSAVVLVVFLSTLFGYGLYTQVKKDAFTAAYRDSIRKISADIFRKDLIFSNVSVKASKDGTQFPVFEGTLLNNSKQPLASILVELSFSDLEGRVLYKEWVKPLVGKNFESMVFSADTVSGEAHIMPGESFSFRHILRNCPEHIVERMSIRRGFARRDPSKDVNFKCSVGALRIL